MGTINIQSTDLSHKAGLTYTGTSDKTIDVDSLVTKVSSTDNAIVRFDGTSGAVQNSSVVIDDSGNVGIGVAPSAWGSINRVIDIGNSNQGQLSLYGRADGANSCGITLNAYRDSSNAWRYKDTSASIFQEMGGGSYYWHIAPSGTAGNAITWTQAMTLNANGNLLVGTTTDNGVDKLQVNGNIKANGFYTGFNATNQAGTFYLVLGPESYNSMSGVVVAESWTTGMTCEFYVRKTYSNGPSYATVRGISKISGTLSVVRCTINGVSVHALKVIGTDAAIQNLLLYNCDSTTHPYIYNGVPTSENILATY